MKICVYAICKNEEKFIKRWYDSVKRADGIYVLDTGSTDNTVKVGDSKTENTVVSVTESGGTNIYNDDHLEASYKLTTETIKGIKSYNRIEQSNGGYLNNTSISCKEVKYPNGGTYYKCGSSFLTNEMKNKYDALIKKGGN